MRTLTPAWWNIFSSVTRGGWFGRLGEVQSHIVQRLRVLRAILLGFCGKRFVFLQAGPIRLDEKRRLVVGRRRRFCLLERLTLNRRLPIHYRIPRQPRTRNIDVLLRARTGDRAYNEEGKRPDESSERNTVIHSPSSLRPITSSTSPGYSFVNFLLPSPPPAGVTQC